MKNKKKIFYKTVYIVVIIVLVLVFLVSAYALGSYIWETQKEKNRYDELAQMVQSATVPTQPPTLPTEPVGGVTDPTEPTEPTPTESPWVQITHPQTGEPFEILPEYAEIFTLNTDVVGWLEIPGTVINYPVMQTPDRRDYYLRRNFDGKYSTGGCLYAREECNIFKPSDNITIYGHRMKNGSMFADLGKYKDEAFAKEHSIIYFNTLKERHTYEVYAVFLTNVGYKQGGFYYHNFIDAIDHDVFDNFTSTCKELSFYDTGVQAQFGDKFITLSTCDYYTDNGRLVVVAKRIS